MLLVAILFITMVFTVHGFVPEINGCKIHVGGGCSLKTAAVAIRDKGEDSKLVPLVSTI